MTRAEYLVELEAHLAGRMPPERLERVIHYYREYFDEAGPGREQKVIEELDTPERLARQILGDESLDMLAVPGRAPRRRLSPIAVPFVILAVILLIVAIIAVTVIMICIAVGGGACIVAGIVAVGTGFSALFVGGFSTTMFFSGLGLLVMGIGVLLILAAFVLARLCFKGIAWMLDQLIHPGEVRA